jgi:hypothetical protein
VAIFGEFFNQKLFFPENREFVTIYIYFKIFSQNGESSPQFFLEISEFPNSPQNKLSV